jgi:hypothetical protein
VKTKTKAIAHLPLLFAIFLFFHPLLMLDEVQQKLLHTHLANGAMVIVIINRDGDDKISNGKK